MPARPVPPILNQVQEPFYPLTSMIAQELPTGVSASRDGSQRLPSKPLRSKRSADAMADGEVGFPMPSRPRVSVALPGPERPQRYLRSDEVDAMMGPLPDPSKMSEKVYGLT